MNSLSDDTFFALFKLKSFTDEKSHQTGDSLISRLQTFWMLIKFYFRTIISSIIEILYHNCFTKEAFYHPIVQQSFMVILLTLSTINSLSHTDDI